MKKIKFDGGIFSGIKGRFLLEFPWVISSIKALVALSLLITILTLAQPLFMMSIYDRVLTSLSVETLLVLTLITLILLVIMGICESQRSKILTRLGDAVDEVIRPKLFPISVQMALQSKAPQNLFQALDSLRNFLAGGALPNLMDIPFAPLYLLVLFSLHPLLGVISLLAALSMIVLAFKLETKFKPATRSAKRSNQKALAIAEAALKTPDILASMGMIRNFQDHWKNRHEESVIESRVATDEMSVVTGVLKSSALIIQSLVLAVACYLVINDDTSIGALFVSNILVMRLVQPLQNAISSWGQFMEAMDSWNTLQPYLSASSPSERERVQLPTPSESLKINGLWAQPPGATTDVIRGLTMAANSGDVIGLVGPSGSGKTTLCRAIVGCLKPRAGEIRLDGAKLEQWWFDDLGQHIGYVPQSVDILDGTVAENIRRFGERNDEAVIEAAKLVDIHQIILNLPDGYDTHIFTAYGALSGGQRQRLALARAIYGSPFMLVLDEPSSNLDEAGRKALAELLKKIRDKSGLVILVTHDKELLPFCNRIIMMSNGKVVKELNAKNN